MIRPIPVLLIGVFLGTPAVAKTTTDYQTWLSAGIRAKLTDRLAFDATVLQKSNPTVTDLHQVYPRVDLSYKAFKFLRLKVGTRYAFVWDEGTRDRQLRFFQDIGSATPTLLRMKLGYRFRFQQTHSQTERSWRPKIRNRIAWSIALSDYFKPGFFYEHFLDLKEAQSHMSADDRRGISVSSRIHRQHRLKLRFFQSTELNGDDDKERIFTVDYTFHL